MRIIPAKAEILSFTPNLLEVIEQAGRVCYKSEDRIGPGTAEKFIRSLLNRETPHESVIEHGTITVRFIDDLPAGIPV